MPGPEGFQPQQHLDNQILPRQLADTRAEDAADLAAANGAWDKFARPGAKASTASIQTEAQGRVDEDLSTNLHKILRLN